MNAHLIHKHDRNLPRYTSYPTAPHFSGSVDEAVYRDWLNTLDPATPLSLYLHVPFCESLCLFCGCHTSVVRHEGPRRSYAALLRAEIEVLAAALPGRFKVAHIHWGGGTPTALPADELRATHEAIAAAFDLPADVEIAVEIDPRHLDDGRVAALMAMGVNRASLGVQDLNPVVQRAVGRIQSAEMTQDVADRLRAAGVQGINVDLIYGLPHQTIESVVATARQAAALGPDRLAVFGYAHVPWMKKHQTLLPEDALPDGIERYAQREAIGATLAECGFEAVGLDHFARTDDPLAIALREGRVRRNFQGYTADPAPVLLGLGASSIGTLPQGHVQNLPRVPEYGAALRDGRLPVARGVALSDEDRARRDAIEQVMCHMVVDVPAVEAAHGMPAGALEPAPDEVAKLVSDGLAQWDGRVLTATEAGRPFLRCLAALFDAYLGSGAGRHARAV